jgi:hypothetical protein
MILKLKIKKASDIVASTAKPIAAAASESTAESTAAHPADKARTAKSLAECGISNRVWGYNYPAIAESAATAPLSTSTTTTTADPVATAAAATTTAH